MKGSKAILAPNGLPAVGADRVRLDKQQRFNPLANWTPDVLTRQLTAFARGEIRDLAWVMEWLETHDDTISAVAPKAKAAVSRHGFDIAIKEEIEESDRGLAEDQQGVLRGFYDRIECGHAVDGDQMGEMRLLVQQMMDGYGKGWAVHHAVWQTGAAGLGVKLVQVPLWFFEATEGRLRFLNGAFDTRGADLETMGGRSAWMISRGRGVMLACAIARMFKQIPLQDWLTYCDRHGMPAFIGKTAAAKGSAGWTDLYDAVSNIGSEFGAVMNTGDSIDVLSLTAAGDLPYEKLIDRMDRSMMTLWRGGDLSTSSRENGTGSNPQQDETDELDADNAVWVSETLNRHLSRTVIDYTYGPGTPMLASLKLRTATRDNVTQDLAVVKSAKEMGVRVSRPWFVGKFGIVEADEGELALGEAAGGNAETLKAEKLKAKGGEGGDLNDPADPSDGDDADADAGDDGDGEDAVNTTPEFKALLANSLAKALGVRPAILAPIRPLIDDLAERSQDGRMTDADFLNLVEDAAMSLPELFDPRLAADLGRDLEAAMGTAAVQGVREALREK